MASAKRARNPRFEVYRSMVGRRDWRWRLYARNGEIVACGEGYASERDAERGVEAVKRAVLSVTAYEVDR